MNELIRKRAYFIKRNLRFLEIDKFRKDLIFIATTLILYCLNNDQENIYKAVDNLLDVAYDEKNIF